MSDVSGSSSAPPPPSGTARVSPAPVTPGQTGQQQTPTQGEPHAQTAHQPAPPDTAVTLAPTLAGLAEGETVTITVLSHDADGRQIVQAPQSVLVTLDPEPLPELSTATIRVTGLAHDHLRAQLTSVDGEPTPTPHAIRLRVVQVLFPSSPTDPTNTTTPNAPPSPQPLALQVGTVVAAQAAPPTPIATAATAASSGPSAPSGSAAPPQSPATFFRIIAATPPATANAAERPVAANTAPPPATSNPATPSGPATPAAPGTAATSAAVQAASPSTRTQAPTPGTSALQSTGAAPRDPTPSATAGSSTTSATPTQVTGTITASPRPDQTLVTTSGGKVVLAQPAPTSWPQGTTLVLEAVDARLDTPATATATANASAMTTAAANTATRPLDQVLMTLGEDWPALRDLAAHTAAAAPATTQAFVEGKVPTANARAAAQIMFFLSVLRSGDVTGWLGGDMMRSLERAGQRGLVERLGDDFRQLRRLGDETSANDWRLLMFPFAAGDKIEPIHLFARGQRRDQSDGDQDVRFVVDLKMSALGALQFDGLLHQKSFDLMVRSHTELIERQRQDISRIFNRGLEAIGYRGQIGFQTVKEFPVSPFNDLLGGRHTSGTIVA